MVWMPYLEDIALDIQPASEPRIKVLTEFCGKLLVPVKFIDDLQTLTDEPQEGEFITNLTMKCGSGICGLVSQEDIEYYHRLTQNKNNG